MAESEAPRGELRADISNAIVQVLHEHTGRGPMKARTYIEEDLVTVILGDTLTPPEQRLVDAGERGIVLELRHRIQMTMREDCVGAVERLTGRTVTAFMSSNHIAPDVAAEVFVLEAQ